MENIKKIKPLNVLSMFDGMACARIALDNVGIPVAKYDAYEIEPNAIKVATKNYSDINEKGDVISATYSENEYDLIMGGSPCQSLSSSNVWLKDGEYGVEGTGKSRLFWEYVRAIKTVKPKWFLFENVGSMKNKDKDIITEALGVEPIRINSSIFTAQNRNRLYWTNIPFDKDLDNRKTNITLQDILESDVDDKYYLTPKMVDCIMRPASKGWQSGKMEIDLQIARPLTATLWKMHRADTDNYVTGIKTPTGKTNIRRLTPIECERLQGVPDNYTSGVSDKQRYTMLGNGWTVPVIAHILKGLNENA